MASCEVRGHTESPGGEGSAENDYRLHRAAFYGNVSEVKDLLHKENLEPSTPDKHGEIEHGIWQFELLSCTEFTPVIAQGATLH